MVIGEVCLLTNDVRRLAAFYKQLLGIENDSDDEVPITPSLNKCNKNDFPFHKAWLGSMPKNPHLLPLLATLWLPGMAKEAHVFPGQQQPHSRLLPSH